MGEILNYGLTYRPCWMEDLPFKDVTIKDVSLRDDTPVDGGVIYYSVENDHTWRYRAFQAKGLPPFVWAPDGYELPGEGETAEARTSSVWGYYVLVFDWEWFLSLHKRHDEVGVHCRMCRLMRKRTEVRQKMEWHLL